jgi:hypothetical protein
VVEERFAHGQPAALAADLGVKRVDLFLGVDHLGELGAGPGRGQVLGADPPTRTRSSRFSRVAPAVPVRVGSLCFFWVSLIASSLQRASAAASLRVIQALSSVDMG